MIVFPSMHYLDPSYVGYCKSISIVIFTHFITILWTQDSFGIILYFLMGLDQIIKKCHHNNGLLDHHL